MALGPIFIAIFVSSLLTFCLTERILHAILCLFLYDKSRSEAKYVISAFLSFFLNVIFGIFSVLFRGLALLSSFALWILVLFIVLSFLYVSYEEYPIVWLRGVEMYNAHVGPFIHTWFLLPLQVLNIFLKGVIPLWNSFFYFFRMLWLQGLLPLVSSELTLLKDIGVTVLEFGRSSGLAVSAYLRVASCPGEICFAQVPELDVSLPMRDVSRLSVLLGEFVGNVCSPVGVPVRLLLYPFGSANLGVAVHNLVNAVLSAVIYLPIVTEQRCDKFGRNGVGADTLMCTPDLGVPKVYVGAGIKALGKVLDEWISTLYDYFLKREAAAITGLTPDVFREGVLEGPLVTVGVSGTLLATTNGSHAAFFSQGTTANLHGWAEGGVDVSFGIAAVRYGVVSAVPNSLVAATDANALLGCSCLDTSGGILVRCRMLPYLGSTNASQLAFDVGWQDSTWRAQMVCSAVEITVRSVRWSVRRLSGNSLGQPLQNCASSNTCESVDATIWLVPKCMYLPAALCSYDATGTSCFPYCMATRKSKSTNQQPVFVSAATWRNAFQLMDRDCTRTTKKTTASAAFLNDGQASSVSLQANSLSAEPLYLSGSSVGCSYGVQTVSWVPANASTTRSLPFSLVDQQPFAIAGDAILIAERMGDGGYLVHAERLFGDQQNRYSLVSNGYTLPAMPLTLVPADQFKLDSSLVVPYTYQQNRILATSTSAFFFYATNPDLTLFQAYFDFCTTKIAGGDELARVQLLLLSSYSPLRVYRVCAYGACETPVRQFTWNGFSNGSVSSTFEALSVQCNRRFNFTISGLEYVNSANIAVTVGETSDAFDPTTGTGLNVKYRTYWLHPSTMEVSGDGMWPLSQAAVVSRNDLPAVGTIGADLLNAGFFLFAIGLETLVYANGVSKLWQGGAVCPLQTGGHSVLESCGETFLNLDDFFDSLEDATQIFWGVLAYAANVLDDNGVEYSQLQDLLRGLSVYGGNTVDILDAGNAAKLLSNPLHEQLRGVFGAMQSQNLATASVRPMVTGLSMARYFWITLSSAGKRLFQQHTDTNGLTPKDPYDIFMESIYESRELFNSLVVNRGISGCTGLGQIFGSTRANPIGKFVQSGCISSVEFTRGVFDLWSILTVDVDFVQCVCVQAAGEPIGYIEEVCVPKVPVFMRSLVLGVSSEISQALNCKRLIPKISTNIHDTMNPWFSSMYASADVMSDVIDYTTVGFDPDAGQCMNWEQNPFVVVIVPQPVDYFQGCAITDMCHSRCQADWDRLQNALTSYSAAATTTHIDISATIESKMFPVGGGEVQSPGTIVALSQPSECASYCDGSTDQCLAAAFLMGTEIRVNYYCVPLSTTRNVYLSAVLLGDPPASVNWGTACPECGAATKIQFVDAEGSALLLLISQTNGNYLEVLAKDGSRKTVLNATLASTDSIPVLKTVGLQPVVIQEVFVLHPTLLLINVVARSQAGTSSRYTLQVSPNDAAATSLVVPSLPGFSGYAWCKYPLLDQSKVIFVAWPLGAVQQPQLLSVTANITGLTVLQTSVTSIPLGEHVLGAATEIRRTGIMSLNGNVVQGKFSAWVNAGEQYNWLSQLRVEGVDSSIASVGVYKSVASTISVQTTGGCDGSDCSGCPDASIRAICATYQRCSVFNCVGTPVNLNRPLCGIGLILRALVLTQLETLHGAWGIIVQMVVVMLQLQVESNVGVIDLSAQEQAFFGHVCAAKDVSAEFFATIVASANLVFDYDASRTLLLQYAAFLDPQIHASPSLAPTAITGFFYHISLAPIYAASAMYQILLCRLAALVAVVDKAGGPIIVLTKMNYTSAAVGQCLTLHAAGLASETGNPASRKQLANAAANLVQVAADSVTLAVLDPIMHTLDAILSYQIGIVSSFATVLQTFDMVHCVTPDVTLSTTAQCACGDQPLQIASIRAAEKTYAYWCTGTLSLLMSDQTSRIVWNPYSFAELRSKMSVQLAAFLKCSEDATRSCTVPNDPVFLSQGVNTMQVFTRCRQNYVNQQWDVGAYAQYDAATLKKQVPKSLGATALPNDAVGPCLLDAFKTGQNNQACTSGFFQWMDWNSDNYWSYDSVDTTDPSRIDGCIVFSGPANNSDVGFDRSSVFGDCMGSSPTNQSCSLSGFVWSPSSVNSVPVASLHVITGQEGTVRTAVETRYAAAFEKIQNAITLVDDDALLELTVAFFSAEGDVIHQLLDCMFLGPFARMDYWPLPYCPPGTTGCLQGPVWARDDGQGVSRNVNPSQCSASAVPPFTCGTNTRKNMMKYFVQTYITQGRGGADMVRQQVREWTQNLSDVWGNFSMYSCPCDNVSSSPYCCDDLENLTAHLTAVPNLLLSTDSVLKNLERLAVDFYEASIMHSDPWVYGLSEEEILAYTWQNLPQAPEIEKDARFDTTKPLMDYTQENAMSPPTSIASAGLWETCHGAIRQMFFTLPVTTEGQLVPAPELFTGGGVEAISNYVAKLVTSSFSSSPLYRHYVTRHAPSASKMCSHTNNNTRTAGKLKFSEVKVGGTLIFSDFSEIPVLGFKSGVLGAWDNSCFCGWTLTSDSKCLVPLGAASLTLGMNSYDLSAQDRKRLNTLYSYTWECPELALSEHFGILDRDASETWLQGNTSLVSLGTTLLQYGPGGLKPGNLHGVDRSQQDYEESDATSTTLKDLVRETIMPSGRSADPSDSVLYSCDPLSKAGVDDLLTEFVDDLFPMSQGVYEPGSVSYCLRFAIELAKLKALEMIGTVQNTTTVQLLERITAQQKIAIQWQRRCASQVQLVSMCSALDVYHPRAAVFSSPCTFWGVQASDVEMYVTPGCLVNVNGTFYDPCECLPDICPTADNSTQTKVTLTPQMLSTSECGMSMDPRRIARPMEMGWWDSTTDEGNAFNTWLSNPVNLLYLELLTGEVLHPSSRIGNPIEGAHWTTAEGFMNESSHYCDMIADYWPDDVVFPVGYHVTVPCMAEDTGYRSFDNIFAADDDDSMVFMEDQTRDIDKIDSLFGAGGLCRSTNFGFNMYKTNTMKICTRTRVDDNVDIHVPKPTGDDSDIFDSEYCSAQATDLPWGSAENSYYDPLMYAVGTVPFLPDADAPEYPYTASAGYVMGPVEDVDSNHWGDGCADFDLPYCIDSSDCADGYNCISGVCMHEKVECINHKMCTQADTMCSGDGRCVPAKVVVFNSLSENASFKVHTTSCSDTSYSMLGASPWGYIPDILQAHGMCSYRDWTAYQSTWYSCVNDSQKTQSQATITGNQCQYHLRSMGVDAAKNSQVKWWDDSSNKPRRLRLEPVSCDRVYERFEYLGKEMKACVPSTSVFRGRNGYQSQAATRERILQPYDVQKRTTSLRNMPFRSNRVSGFLNTANTSASINTQSCSSLRQCFMAQFTRNGFSSMTTTAGLQTVNRKLADGAWYNAQDAFQCGIFARFRTSTGLCEIDRKVVPLYSFFCEQLQALDPRGWCSVSLGSFGEIEVQQWCDIIRDNYQPVYSVIQANADAFAGLITAFGKVVADDLDTGVAITECATLVYSHINTLDTGRRTLYFPFPFILYEFPFPWFYQCVITGQASPVLTKSKWTFPCVSYSRASTANISNYQTTSSSDSFREYVQTVRGGYTENSVQTYIANSLATTQQTWSQCVAKTVSEKFLGVDETTPTCSNEMKWKALDMQYNLYARYLIQTFAYPSCSAIIQPKTVLLYNQNPLAGLDLSTINASNIDTLIDLLVESPKGNYTRQSDGASTIMQMIDAWGRTKLEEQAGTPLLKDVSLAQKYPVQFNATMTMDYSDLLTLLKFDPEFQLSTDFEKSVVGYTDEGAIACPYAQQELYHPDDDPYKKMGFSQPMLICPTYNKGRFNCHYPPYKYGDGTVEFTSKSRLTHSVQMTTYATHLLDDVRGCYQKEMQNSPISPLAPSDLPFFQDESALGFKNFQFDFSYVAKYTAEINPNTDTSIMCTVGNQELQFTNCSDSNYAALQAHVLSQYTKDGPIVIPSNLQMEWKLGTRDTLTTNSIYSFASTERPLTDQFVWQMMDPASSCVSLGTDNSERVCTLTGTTKNVLTPWTAGEWNPYDGCDVYHAVNPTERDEELIDARCEKGPPWCNANGEMGTTATCNAGTGQQCFYDYMPLKTGQTACVNRDRQKTVSMNIRPSLYNLCSQELVQDAVCMHTQGVLGGGDGGSLQQYNDLYSKIQLNYTEDFGDTIFANPVFTGTCAGYGYGMLRMPESHIGGHILGLQIEWVNETTKEACLRVAKLPLKNTVEGILPDWESADVKSGWVEELVTQLDADEAAYIATLGVGVVSPSWDCPLRRRVFYSNGSTGWGPNLPSARRSKRLFGKMTGDSYAHPTQQRSESGARFGKYTTFNGFCFCPSLENPTDEQCQINTNILDSWHPCSLLSTVRAIRGVNWQSSYTFQPYPKNTPTSCKVQLDWPFVGGNMRDGTSLHTAETSAEIWADASDVERRRCHVLDRMREFNYTYRSMGPLEQSDFSTLAHGVCHTGRVQRRVQTDERCARFAKNSDSSVLWCAETPPVTTNRRRSRPPWRAVSQRRRQRCNQCSKTPQFKTRKGVKLEPESSFGLPYRYAAERVMAADLKKALCAESTDCLNSLNKTAWTSGNFFRTFLADPRGLFANFTKLVNLSKSSILQPSQPPDETTLWAKPWMYCPTQTALSTGINCTGAITREQWRQSKTTLCPKAVQEGSRGQTSRMVETSVCEISGSLSNLCAAITEARNLIGAANCLKTSQETGSGACAIKEHVYTPATWENSNMAFVHETVTNYYKRMDNCPDSVDCICPVDYNLTLIKEQNSKLLSSCSATDASAVAIFLTQARGLVQQLTQILAHILNMVLQTVLTLQPGSAGAAAKTRMYQGWFSLSSMMESAKGAVSDIGTNTILMNGVVGPALRIAIREACGAYNTALSYFTYSYCTFVIDKLPVFTTALDSTFGYVDVALSTVNDFINVIVRDVLPQALVAMVYKGYDKFTSGLMVTDRLRGIRNERLSLATAGVVGQLAEESKTTGTLAQQAAKAELLGAMQSAKTPVAQKNILTRAIDKLALVDRYAMPVAVVASLAIGIKGAVDDAKNAKLLEEAIAKAPEMWTYVDFSTIRVVLQDLTDYLFLSNAMCVDPPDNMTCPNFTLPDDGTTNTTYVAPQATQCWADAQTQDFGISNLYACSPSSTCMVDALSSETMMCAECPLAQSTLFVPYGCNVMQQRCQCNILSTKAAPCTTNSDCTDSGFCSLRKDVGGTSFGVNTCGACPTTSICIIQTPGSPGSCTCLGNLAPYQLCDSGSLGEQLLPKPPLLELYSTQPPSEFYLWGDSALIPASQARRATCVQVATMTGVTVTIAMATTVFPSTTSQASRRLLADVDYTAQVFTDYPDFFTTASPSDQLSLTFLNGILNAAGWNTTSSPCSTVVLAFQQGHPLTPADENLAHTCAYWRHVGAVVIQKFNLTTLRELDTFLLSSDDFAAALGHKGVLGDLVSHPTALMTAAMYSSWFKPIRAAFWLHYHKHIRNVLEGSRHYWDLLTNNTRNYSTPLSHMIHIKQSPRRNFTKKQAAPKNQSVVVRRQGRRLLETSAEVLAAAESSHFYYLFARNTPTPPSNFTGTCPPAQITLTTGLQITHVLTNYYTHFDSVHANQNISTSLWSLLPAIKLPTLTGDPTAGWQSYGSYSGAAVRTVLSVFGSTVDDVVNFFTSTEIGNNQNLIFNYILTSLTSCDYAGLMMCQNHTRDFFSALVLAFVFYLFVNSVLSFFGVPIVGTLLFYSIPLLALWYSYGVSPLCFPMVPPCFADDILSRINSVFPLSTNLPPGLFCEHNVTSRCLVKCSSLGFDHWQDPLAYAVAAAGWDLSIPDSWKIQDVTDIITGKNWTANVEQKKEFMHSPDADAYTACCFVTAVATLPVLLVLLGVLVAATSLVSYIFGLIPHMVILLWQILVTTSTRDT